MDQNDTPPQPTCTTITSAPARPPLTPPTMLTSQGYSSLADTRRALIASLGSYSSRISTGKKMFETPSSAKGGTCRSETEDEVAATVRRLSDLTSPATPIEACTL